MARGQTVGGAVGLDEERRARNVAYINNKLARMQAEEMVISWEHRREDRRDGGAVQIDVWELMLPGDQHPFTYTFPAARALIRGYELGRS